ncbi:MAG: GNAT family N-acetyltransferase, partial [Clostridia bacterium]|nr:GNAT family N-acetyltransferase [Clostridia bacterium]
VDWVEYRIFSPKEPNERIERVARVVSKRYNLKVVKPTSIKKFVAEYKDQFFQTLDEAYSPLYGVVPFSEKMKDSLIDQFSLILNKDFIVAVVNEQNQMVGFGLVFPSLSEAVNKSQGKLLPFGIFRMLRQIKKPKSIDLGLIAIKPEYQNKGVNTLILSELINGMIEKKIEYAETNLMLEDNIRIQSQWDIFDYIQHKRRRSYRKEID